MEFEKLERIEKRISDLLSENEKALAETGKRLAEAETKLKTAQERSAAAIRRGDKKCFADAETETRETRFDIEFLRQRLEALKSDPLMPEAEYREALTAIQAEADEGMRALADEVTEIFRRLAAIRDEGNALTRRADAAILTLQKKLAKLPNGATARIYTFPQVEQREGYTPSLPRDLVAYLNSVLSLAGIEQPTHL